MLEYKKLKNKNPEEVAQLTWRAPDPHQKWATSFKIAKKPCGKNQKAKEKKKCEATCTEE